MELIDLRTWVNNCGGAEAAAVDLEKAITGEGTPMDSTVEVMEVLRYDLFNLELLRGVLEKFGPNSIPFEIEEEPLWKIIQARFNTVHLYQQGIRQILLHQQHEERAVQN